MANIKLTNDYWEASGVYDITYGNGKTQRQINSELNGAINDAVPKTRKVNNKALSSDITLTAADVSAVPTSRTVNSKALSADVTLAASDVGAVPMSRKVNNKSLSSDITLAAGDIGFNSSTTYSANTVGKEVSDLKKSTKLLSNANLLDNWYFGNGVINTRLFTSYSAGGGYSVDRWYRTGSAIAVALNSDYIRLTKSVASGNPAIVQELGCTGLVGKKVTFSVLYKTNSSAVNAMIGGTAQNIPSSTSISLFTKTVDSFSLRSYGEYTNAILAGVILTSNFSTSEYFDVYAAKLEYGDTQTLAHQENSTWVLNEIPNYSEEYVKSWRTQRRVSIIGDSISTYDGYLPDGYSAHYPNGDVNSVDKTYWMQWLKATGNVLKVNASYGGSRVTSRSGYPDFYARTAPSIIGTPDDIIVALGTNDSSGSVTLGNYDYTTAYTSLSESTFRTAYIKGIKSLQDKFPMARIHAIILKMKNEYALSIIDICNTLGVCVYDCRDYTPSNNVHPDAAGMQAISNLLLSDTKVSAIPLLERDRTSEITYPLASPPSGNVRLITVGNIMYFNLMSGSRAWAGADGDVLAKIPTDCIPSGANDYLVPCVLAGSGGTQAATIKFTKSTGNVTIASTVSLSGNFRAYVNTMLIL